MQPEKKGRRVREGDIFMWNYAGGARDIYVVTRINNAHDVMHLTVLGLNPRSIGSIELTVDRNGRWFDVDCWLREGYEHIGC